MIAHDKEHTERLLARSRLFIQLMNGPKPLLGKESESELIFKKTNASFYIGTAGSKNFGRSDTITHLHCSEVAFWKDPKPLLSGLFQAVPHDTGVIVKECTANGYGTYHHRQYKRAEKGMSRFHAKFYPWVIFPEYTTEQKLLYPLVEEEIELKKKFFLSDGQIQWRREKIEEFEGDQSQFKQEYPSTVDEAFMMTGGSLFPVCELSNVPEWIRKQSPLSTGVFKALSNHPQKGLHYVIGVDTASGTGGDNSVAQICCVESTEQVGIFVSNTIPPPQFAQAVAYFGKIYGTDEGTADKPDWKPAFLIPERNNHGISLIALLRDTDPYVDFKNRMFKDPKVTQTQGSMLLPLSGFVTSGTSKYRLIGILQNMLSEITIHDDMTIEEIRGFTETSMGTMTNKDAEHDDRVIALALCAIGILKERRMGVIAELEAIKKSSVVGDLLPQGFRVTFEDIVGSIKKAKDKNKDFFGNQSKTNWN